MVGRGSGTVTGSSPVAAGGILNTGIPGMSGNPDMRYTGVVRMRGMPYRSALATLQTRIVSGPRCENVGMCLWKSPH